MTDASRNLGARRRVQSGMDRIATCLAGSALAAGVVVTGATSAHGICSQPSIGQAADQSDAVFVGTTLDAVEGRDNTFEVRASDIYQGSPGAFLTVSGGDAEGGYGDLLAADRQYLFFVTRAAGPWRTLGCGTTQPISSQLIAQADRVLGPATPLRVAPATGDSGPAESPSATADPGPNSSQAAAEDSDSSAWVWLGGGIAALVAAGLVAAATRRRR